jgi:hypothetical protein
MGALPPAVERCIVLIPVLGRPHRAEPVASSIRATCDARIMFLVSPTDQEEYIACRDTGEFVMTVGWDPGPGDFARKINLGFKISSEPLIFLGADDLDFQPGWLDYARSFYAGVIGTDDQANPLVKRGKHATHSLVRRSYIEQHGGTFLDGPGIVYHEGYDHQYVDTELVEAAKARGEWAFSRLSVVRHLHPMYDKSQEMDDTYRKALAEAKHDQALYRERRRQARAR